MRSLTALVLGFVAAGSLLAQTAAACVLAPGYDHAAAETRGLRGADTVVRGEVIGVTGGGPDNGGSVWVRRTDLVYGSKAPRIVELGDSYWSNCPRDYFMADNEVHVGDQLLIIGSSADSTEPAGILAVFFIDDGSPEAARLLAQWRQFHPDIRPAGR